MQYKRCNDKLDCEDGSDEENCTVVKVPLDYRSGEPPKLEENITNLIGQISLTRAGLGLLYFILIIACMLAGMLGFAESIAVCALLMYT